MAFTLNTLCNIGGYSQSGVAPALFTYRTTDNLAAVTAANYITNTTNPGITNMLTVGDIILCVQSATLDKNSPVTTNFDVYVSGIANGVISLAQRT